MEVRRTAALLIVMVAVFFTGFLSSQPEETTNYENCIAVKKFTELLGADGANHSQQYPAEHGNGPNCRPPKWYAIFRRIEGWQFIVAVIGIGVIAWQSFATSRSAKAAEDGIALMINKERPWLTVDLDDLDLSPRNGIFEVTFKVKIFGATPAFIADAQCSAFVVPKKYVAEGETGDRAMLPFFSFPSTISPDHEPIEGFALIEVDNDIARMEIEEVKKRRLYVGIRGFIVYNDVFRRTRRTSFRYFCDYSEIPGMGDGWIKCGEPEENEAT